MGAWTFVQKQFHKTNNLLNQFALLCLIVVIGFFIIRSVNTNSSINSDNSLSNYFLCEISSINEDSLPIESLKTEYTISLVNIDNEIFKTANLKNSIPALFKPSYTKIEKVKPCLNDNDIALVLSSDNTILVFPEKILNYHLLINTYIKDEPILVSYSPLANHYEVYSRQYKNLVLEFGVSGLLYNNTDLMFDTSSESLWSQFNGKAIVGNYSGASLKKIEYKLLSIKNIYDLYDNFEILSFNTGYSRNYNNDPFVSYRTDNSYIAPISNTQNDFNNKDIVLGINIENRQYAILESSITDNVYKYNKLSLELEISKKDGEYIVNDIKNNKRIYDLTTTYAFIWYDFFPYTRILKID